MLGVRSQRGFNIFEYQSKEICQRYNVSVGTNVVAFSPSEAEAAFRRLGGPAVVKAQVYAGGRGKGYWKESGVRSGIHFVKSSADARRSAGEMIGNHLVTQQTGSDGVPCKAVLLSAPVKTAREYYFAILLDRATQAPVVIVSREGGVEIEEVAHSHPERIARIQLDGIVGIDEAVAGRIGVLLGLKGLALENGKREFQKLWKLFVGTDAVQVEVNPLTETTDGEVITVDAKFGFDDSAHYRQKQIFGYRDLSSVNPHELRADKFGMNYIELEGDIACLVNGAGLAMATMDVIKLSGGNPANFLDLGGAASEEAVTEGFLIIQSNPRVKCILVNIFGGIVKCDMIARGIIAAVKRSRLSVPLVVRLEGTNVTMGKELLANSGLPIIAADGLTDAGVKAVIAAKGG